MNVELLRKIADVIQQKPAKFQMEYLHMDRGGSAVQFEECGTAHCIAGWGAVLTGKSLGNGSFGRAIRVNPEAEMRLIFLNLWPEAFSGRYNRAKQKRTKAKITAERIEHFIKTRGKE